MDLLELVLFSVVSALVAATLPYVIPVLAAACLHRRVVRGNAQIRRLDGALCAGGHAASLVTDDSGERPADGWHLVWRGGASVVAIRATASDTSGRADDKPTYSLFSAHRSGLEQLLGQGERDGRIAVMQYEALMPWSTTATTTRRRPPGDKPNAAQGRACTSVLKRFKATGRCTALLTGKPGEGKARPPSISRPPCSGTPSPPSSCRGSTSRARGRAF